MTHIPLNAAHAAAPSSSPATHEPALHAVLRRLGLRKKPANTAAAINIFDDKAMNTARKSALAWADYVRECYEGTSQANRPAHGTSAPKLADIPEDVLHGIIAQALVSHRFFLSFRGMLSGQPVSLTTVPDNSCVVDFDKDKATFIAEMVPRARIMEIIAALARRAMQ